MFYISSVNGSNATVVDTADWSEEIYQTKFLVELAKQIMIWGVDGEEVRVFDLEKYIRYVMSRDKMHGIESKYVIRNGKIIFRFLRIPENKAGRGATVTYKVADGTFEILGEASGSNRNRESVLNAEDRVALVLPESCKVIGEEAFQNTRLTSINLEHICIIGNYAFLYSRRLPEKLSIRGLDSDKYKKSVLSQPSSYNLLGTGCFSYTNMKEIDFGDFPQIPVNCCANCYKLQNVFGDNIKEIKKGAFHNNHVLGVVAPLEYGYHQADIKIENSAFEFCPKLSSHTTAALERLGYSNK